MDVAAFDFHLPPDLIAQTPSERGAARLLVLDRSSGSWRHERFTALSGLLKPRDLVVVNNTRVFPARLLGVREPGGGRVECLLLAPIDADRWDALVHPGQKLRAGSRVRFERGGRTLLGEILERHFYGRRSIRLWTADGSSVDDAIDAIGHVPLPPYIRRADTESDRDRYQTVYASARGSVAAPTAGLHFTPEVLGAMRARAIQIAEITLHVGYGTFKPVRSERVEDHVVDPEAMTITPAVAAAIDDACRSGRRVVAVGTTTTRAIESAARATGRVVAGSGTTDLFIAPGFEFRVTGALVTNFHLPKSSLLMLVCAFAGRDLVLAAYRAAVSEGYRFYSYGDAMLIV